MGTKSLRDLYGPPVPAGTGWLAVWLCSLIATSPTNALANQFIDTRQGVRTYFHGAQFTGFPPAGDFYGWSMAFGDVDGDGVTDFLSSSANAEGPNDEDPPESDAYLVFGRSRSEIDSVYAIDTPGVAGITFYRGGFAVACADLDNDGFDDLILAEVIAHDGVYVVFGGPRNQLRSSYQFKADRPDYTPPDVHIIGATWLGGSVIDVTGASYDLASREVTTGDINGDGYADIILGNDRACDPAGPCPSDGAAYVIFGRPRNQFPPVIDVDYTSALPHPDVLIRGDGAEHYPFALAVGDLDGDHIDDLLASTISGYGEGNVTPGTGEIHGWFGKYTWKPVYDTQIDDFDFALQGGQDYKAGFALVTGDVDGDGRDDLIVGSPTGDRAALPGDRLNMGEYRILFGRSRSLWPKWGGVIDMTDVLILGAETGDAFNLNGPQEWGICFSMATGDRDGDAYRDLVIGAGQVRRPDDGLRPGAAYLLRGRPRSAWEPLIDLRDGYNLIVYGADEVGSAGYETDRFGFVTGMGDLDGNGRDEIFVAAPFADGPNNSIPDCGEISVIYDSDNGSPTGSTIAPPSVAHSSLLPNYPNPFRATTTLQFQAPIGDNVSLTIYDALGREVARPLPQTTMHDNTRGVEWAGIDERGAQLPSGVYFVKLRAGSESHARKVLLVR